MTRYCRAHVPEEILNALEPIKDSDEDVRNFAIQLGVDMCQKVYTKYLSSFLILIVLFLFSLNPCLLFFFFFLHKLIELGCPGLHFYTLNLEKTVVRIIENLQYVEPVSHRRPLPWRRSADERRATEDVRLVIFIFYKIINGRKEKEKRKFQKCCFQLFVFLADLYFGLIIQSRISFAQRVGMNFQMAVGVILEGLIK